MSASRRGRWIALSPARRMVDELLHHAKKVPSLPVARHCRIPAAVEARSRLREAPSWTAIFMRAYGLLGRSHPELRRAFIPLPWKHLYEHPESECGILVEREWQGEQAVLGGKLRAPEDRSLGEIQAYLHFLKETPVQQVNYFRKWLRVGGYPAWLRRLVFWQSLYVSGYTRAKRFGTFNISSMGTLGAEQMHPITPLTTYLTFGPISRARGDVEVKIIYDHRVTDERTIARILAALEDTINIEMATELNALATKAA